MYELQILRRERCPSHPLYIIGHLLNVMYFIQIVSLMFVSQVVVHLLTKNVHLNDSLLIIGDLFSITVNLIYMLIVG